MLWKVVTETPGRSTNEFINWILGPFFWWNLVDVFAKKKHRLVYVGVFLFLGCGHVQGVTNEFEGNQWLYFARITGRTHCMSSFTGLVQHFCLSKARACRQSLAHVLHSVQVSVTSRFFKRDLVWTHKRPFRSLSDLHLGESRGHFEEAGSSIQYTIYMCIYVQIYI